MFPEVSCAPLPQQLLLYYSSRMYSAMREELAKLAVGRSVQEWRKMMAGGDVAGADELARQYASAGNAPRYLQDVSIGGGEAGVDRLMGRAGAAPVATDPNLQQRFQQYQANKAALGLQGKSPGPSVLQSPEGRAILTRGGAPTAPAAPPNESGYIARKLYKPDAAVSRGEYTSQLLEQKQRTTDIARGLSPEAKQMMPAMYGYEAHQTPGGLRHTSQHEWVTGMKPFESAHDPGVEAVKKQVLDPMQARGMTLGDTVQDITGKSRWMNPGNVVQSSTGPKVVDYLPSIAGEANPALQSYEKYKPTGAGQYKREAQLGALRKDVFTGSGAPSVKPPVHVPAKIPSVMPKAPAISGVVSKVPRPGVAAGAGRLLKAVA